MTNTSLQVSSNITLQVLTVGKDKTPVIVIDDFAINTNDIIEHACNEAQFNALDNTHYPGIRAPLPKDYVINVLQAVYQEICRIYNIPTNLQLKPQEIYFSLITKKAEELSLLQRMPHFDTSRPFYFAVLHYLNAGEHGNTGLFRHNPTGLEKIENHNTEKYLTAAQNFIDTHGERSQTYFTESDEHFELYHQIEYKPNRLVIYPGQLLHSIIISPQHDIDPNPNTGRLTANIFIEFT
ncbi:MAG: DUF6445 family protein [Thalassotalea sp.]|nr:DUF6445 family protein [Thalassotalea sp.]